MFRLIFPFAEQLPHLVLWFLIDTFLYVNPCCSASSFSREIILFVAFILSIECKLSSKAFFCTSYARILARCFLIHGLLSCTNSRADLKDVRRGTATRTPLPGRTLIIIRRARELRSRSTAPIPSICTVWES